MSPTLFQCVEVGSKGMDHTVRSCCIRNMVWTCRQNRWRLGVWKRFGCSAAAVFHFTDRCSAWYGRAVVMEDRMHCLTTGAHIFQEECWKTTICHKIKMKRISHEGTSKICPLLWPLGFFKLAGKDPPSGTIHGQQLARKSSHQGYIDRITHLLSNVSGIYILVNPFTLTMILNMYIYI